MPEHNVAVSRIFQEIADLLEVEDANPFRIRAYCNAARTVGGYGQELTDLVARGQPLPKLSGIGEDLGAKIVEIAQTGGCRLLARLQGEVPPAVASLLALPGLGPKRVHTLYHELAITRPADLQRALDDGVVRTLPGFGPRLEQQLRDALARHRKRGE